MTHIRMTLPWLASFPFHPWAMSWLSFSCYKAKSNNVNWHFCSDKHGPFYSIWVGVFQTFGLLRFNHCSYAPLHLSLMMDSGKILFWITLRPFELCSWSLKGQIIIWLQICLCCLVACKTISGLVLPLPPMLLLRHPFLDRFWGISTFIKLYVSYKSVP